ncbi:MAG: hypothetical protein R3E67_00705 [Pseudomonadales bacterium]
MLENSKTLAVLKIFLINVVILFMLVEISSYIFICITDSAFSYNRNIKNTGNIQEIENQTEKDANIFLQIHPYIGFSPRASNNLGFDSDVDYPYAKKDGEYIVGIFGGSVAKIFKEYEEREHDLEIILERYFSGIFMNANDKNKVDVKFINFLLGYISSRSNCLLLTMPWRVGSTLMRS